MKNVLDIRELWRTKRPFLYAKKTVFSQISIEKNNQIISDDFDLSEEFYLKMLLGCNAVRLHYSRCDTCVLFKKEDASLLKNYRASVLLSKSYGWKNYAEANFRVNACLCT